jgi:hypothetical protein
LSGVSEEEDSVSVLNKDMRIRSISQHEVADALPVEATEINQSRQAALRIRLIIEQLQKRGVRIILFKPPNEPAIDKLLRQRNMDALLFDVFPKDQFKWLEIQELGSFQTTDGIHLNKKGCRILSAQIAGACSVEK